MKKILRFVARQCYWTACLLAIFLVLFISVSRFFLPDLVANRTYFEKAAAKVLGHPVTIGQVSAWWDGVEPVFRFDRVSVLEKNGGNAVLKVRRLQVNVNIVRSLWKRRVEVEDLSIQGVGLEVTQLKNSHVDVNGFSDAEVTGSETKQRIDVPALLSWLFSQPNLFLSDLNVSWRDLQGRVLPLSVEILHLQNRRLDHLVSGRFSVKSDAGAQFEFNSRIRGNWEEPKKLSGKLYLHFNRLKLQNWLSRYHVLDKASLQGLLNGKLWLDWQRGQFKKVQVLFQGKDIKFQSLDKKEQLNLSYGYGQLGWYHKKDQGWVFSGDHLLFSFPQNVFQIDEFKLIKTLEVSNKAKMTLWIKQLNLGRFSQALLNSHFLPDQFSEVLGRLAPQGIVKNLSIEYSGNKIIPSNFYVQTEFRQLGVKAWENFPGVSGVSGRGVWKSGRGFVKLDSQNVALQDPNLFLKPLIFQTVSGDVYFYQQPNEQMTVLASAVRAKSKNLSLEGDLGLLFPIGKKPTLSLLMQAKLDDVSDSLNYLPAKIFHPKLVSWLDQAFLSGKANAILALRGVADKSFPYQAYPALGRFIANIDLNHVDFSANKNWPLIRDIQGRLSFVGAHMQFKLLQGNVLGSEVTHLIADVPHIADNEKTLLFVSGDVESDAKKLVNFVFQSPLQRKIGPVFSGNKFTGPVSLSLQMMLPVMHVDSGAKVFGQLYFKGNHYQLENFNWPLTDLRGVLRFNEEALLPSVLEGYFLQAPMRAELTTQRLANNHLFLEGTLESALAPTTLGQLLNYPMIQFVKGRTAYQAYFKVDLSDSHHFTTLQAESDLFGMAIDLPKPLGKLAYEEMPLRVDLTISDRHLSALRVVYKNEETFSCVDSIEKPGAFDLVANLSEFTWKNWQPFLKKYNKQDGRLLDKLASVKIKLKQAIFHQQLFSDALIYMTPKEHEKRFYIESPAILGALILPENFERGVIQGDFERLYLVPLDNIQGLDSFSPENFPALRLDIKDFRYGKKIFGKTHLTVSRVPQGIHIDKFSIFSNIMKAKLVGDWTIENNIQKSVIEGELKIKNLETLFSQWDYTSSLKAKAGKMLFSLGWRGAPYDFNTETLEGLLKVNLNQGVLENVGKATAAKLSLGRFLNLLDVESMAKRLTINSSDVSEESYAFNAVEADLLCKNDSIEFKKMTVDGLVADLDLSGHVELKTKEYDFFLTVTPNVTGSLPLMAGIITVNPFVGLATWVANKLLSPEVGKLAAYHYRVTGPWKNPVIELLD